MSGTRGTRLTTDNSTVRVSNRHRGSNVINECDVRLGVLGCSRVGGRVVNGPDYSCGMRGDSASKFEEDVRGDRDAGIRRVRQH